MCCPAVCEQKLGRKSINFRVHGSVFGPRWVLGAPLGLKTANFNVTGRVFGALVFCFLQLVGSKIYVFMSRDVFLDPRWAFSTTLLGGLFIRNWACFCAMSVILAAW